MLDLSQTKQICKILMILLFRFTFRFSIDFASVGPIFGLSRGVSLDAPRLRVRPLPWFRPSGPFVRNQSRSDQRPFVEQTTRPITLPQNHLSFLSGRFSFNYLLLFYWKSFILNSRYLLKHNDSNYLKKKLKKIETICEMSSPY